MANALFEVESRRRMGEFIYKFYFPLCFGSFVVRCWTKNNGIAPGKNGSVILFEDKREAANNEEYGLILYENGEIVDPLVDKRFMNCGWAKTNVPWCNRMISQAQLSEVVAIIIESAIEELMNGNQTGEVNLDECIS
jgi:hypothetical protein